MSEQKRTVTIIPARINTAENKIKRQLRVAAYCRVSTEEEEQLSSYEAQCKYYTEKIMSNPEWTMAGIYADEGITGTSTKKREEFKRMIRHCRQKKIDLILTKSISRFARNTVDCLNYIRALKELGIAVYFEKENINTMSSDSELIITLMGAFAQSESESISANVRWGKRQAMREGKPIIQYKYLYGFKKGADGNPEIVSEQAEVVQKIYDKFLAGYSLRMLLDMVTEQRIPYFQDMEWSISNIRGILTNEKYCGDVLMQKSYIADCISKKNVKNTGQLPMYLIRNNHKGIISRDAFNAVQAELARRNAGKSPSKKNAPTGKTSYASKYALSERLVCGECGTLYRRCTWTQKGEKRVVWRCVSRLDYGKQYCKNSPTLHENLLQEAILNAVNSVMSPKETLVNQITDAMQQEILTLPDSTLTLGEINRRIGELEEEMAVLLTYENALEIHGNRFSEIAEEMKQLKQEREALSTQLRNNVQAFNRLQKATIALDQADHRITEWSEETIRQLVHTVKVISKDHIKVYLYDGTEIDQEVRKQ